MIGTLLLHLLQVEEVEADLELIVSNALAFNRDSDPVYKFALELQEVFRHELSNMKHALEAPAEAPRDIATTHVEKRPRMQ